jgi:hypothetical protein
MGIAVLALANLALAQAPSRDDGTARSAGSWTPATVRSDATPQPGPGLGELPNPVPQQPGQAASPVQEIALPVNAGEGPGPSQGVTLRDELARLEQEAATLRAQAAQQGAAQQDEQTKKRLEILEKQIETLEKLVRLLADQLKKQPPTEKLETQVATLESRAVQAARRDRELANGLDTLNDSVDAQDRYGPALPWTLKQLFDPFDNNETPLSIYGALAFGYSKIAGNAATAANGAGRPATPGGFYFGEFTPDFFLKLNDWILLAAEIGAGGDGSVSLGAFAEADFFVTDWLTISAGRMVAPIGWYSLRSNNPWVTKLPTDAPGSQPLLWMQVLPLFSLLGVEASGSCYLGCSPVKLEYNAFISNGLNFTPAAKSGNPDINELANLENMTGNTLSIVTNDKAFGGRIGLWWPETGLAGGISGMYNGDYIAGDFEDALSLWALDLNYHKGDWEVRLEYGTTYQHTTDFIKDNIRRRGFNAEVAYRAFDCPNRYLQNLEFIYRYGYVDFKGIDPTALDLSTFSTPVDVPVHRQQHELGIDYWFYPRMVLKLAYQLNNEPGFHLHDNQFITEFAWGW